MKYTALSLVCLVSSSLMACSGAEPPSHGGEGGQAGSSGSSGEAGNGEEGAGYEFSVKAPDSFYGISPNDTTLPGDPFYQDFESDNQANVLRALGAGLVRINFCNWPASKTALENKVNAARNAGLAVIASLDYCTVPGPSQDPSFDARQAYWHSDYSKIDTGNAFVQAFSQAAGEIAKAFVGRVTYYSIWNEPDAVAHIVNGAWDWDGACRPLEGGYYYGKDEGGKPYGEQEGWALCPRLLGTLTTQAFEQINAADPSAKVVAGNIILQGPNPGDLSDAYYDALRGSPAVQWHMENKNRLPWDIVGIHPYYYAPVKGSTNSLEDELQHWKGRVETQVAITEYGWSNSSCDPAYVEPGLASDYVRDAFAVARDEGLPFVVWFNYLSVPPGEPDANGVKPCVLDMGLRSGEKDHPWQASAQGYCDATGASSCPLNDKSLPAFCPEAFVPRSKMAVYLEKWQHINEPGWAPPPAAHIFTDVPPGSPEEPWIEQLFHDGVTKGYGGDTSIYGPSASVPREQMAAFLMRMKFHSGDLPPPAQDPFKDVPAANQFAGDIQKLHELQITVGCDDQGNFCPNDMVPRQQMAAFLMRAIHGYDSPPPKNSGSGRFSDVSDDNELKDYIAQAVDSGIMQGCE